MHAISQSAAIAAIAALLSGCATPATTNIEAAVEWGTSLRHLGISAFYPPREDVRVGDILLLIASGCSNRTDAGYPRSILLGHLDSQALANLNKGFYGWRGDLPSLTSSRSTSGGGAEGNSSSVTTTPNLAAAKAKAAKAKTELAAATATQKKARGSALASAKARTKKATTSYTAANKALAEVVAAAKKASAPTESSRGSDLTMHIANGQNLAVSTTGAKPEVASAEKTSTSPVAGEASKSAEKAPEQSKDNPIFAVDDDGKLRAKAQPYSRLRQAAFPSVELGTASELGADANVPLSGALNLFAGASRKTSSQITVSATNVVEDQLPLPQVYAAANSFFRSSSSNLILDHAMITKIVQMEESRIQALIREAGPKAIKACGIWEHRPPVYVITSQVFYAYAFDFDVGNKVGYAGALAARLNMPSNASTTSTTSGTTTTTSQTATNATTPSEPYLPTQIQSTSAAGGGLHVEYGETGNLVLKQSFDHPLAFGYIGDARFTYAEAAALHQQAPPVPNGIAFQPSISMHAAFMRTVLGPVVGRRARLMLIGDPVPAKLPQPLTAPPLNQDCMVPDPDPLFCPFNKKIPRQPDGPYMPPNINNMLKGPDLKTKGSSLF